MPEIIKRKRTGKRSKSLRRRLRSWYARNRTRANVVIAAVIAAAIGLTLAFAMFDRGESAPSNNAPASAP